MNLQFASDLHLEFTENRKYIKTNPIIPKAETLVLAGDIMPFYEMDKYKDFFKYCSDHFKTTYWLPGNHDYYHFDVLKKSGSFKEDIRKNVHLVNNYSIIQNTKTLIFTTLWSHISSDIAWQIENRMNDFRLKRRGQFRLSTDYYNELHQQSLLYLKTEVANNSNNDIAVFTHHCPTFINYPSQYLGSILNEGFATELAEYIESSNIKHWVFGHHHSNFSSFQIGKTLMHTNQLGYVHMNEHHGFDNCRIVEL